MKCRRTWIVMASLALAPVAQPALSDSHLISIELPPGAIIGFVGVMGCPDGWVAWEVAKGRYLRGADERNAPGSPGGDPTHSHEGTTSRGGHNRGVDRDNDYHTSDITHVHSVTTDEQSNDPPYVSVLFCRLVGGGD